MLSLSLKKKRACYAFNISKKERLCKDFSFPIFGETINDCVLSRIALLQEIYSVQCTCVCVCVCVCVCARTRVRSCVRVCILKLPKHFFRCIALAMCDLLRHACCWVLLALYGSSNSTTFSTNYYNAVVMRMKLYNCGQ